VPPAAGPLVSVIIPARNEAQGIAGVVSSILGSTYTPFEVLVVDDRSSDDTAGIVTRLASEDPRLRLIPGADLPEGWYGKPWACHQGYRGARGNLLLFTDADTRHGPELLARAVGALEATGADLLTVAPHQRCVTFWERVIMPQVWLLLGLRYHPAVVNRARRASDVIANGQFVLVRRPAYESVGTHAAVRGEVAEDLALAQQFWAAGKTIHFAFADRLMDTRMYTGLRHLIEGWSKNLYLGGRRSFPDEPVRRALVPVLLAAAALFWLIPPVLLAAGWLGITPAKYAPPATLAIGSSLVFWGLLKGGMRIPPGYAIGYPLGALMLLYITVRSTVRGRGRVEWKGRTYGEDVNRS
jgi:chlorobactene glucosyltransferase